MIKNVIFDLSEVYLRGLWGTHELLSKTLKERVLPEDLYNEAAHQFFLGKLTEEQYWKTILEKQKWDIDVAELKRTVRENFEEIGGVRTIIETLKRQGYNLGLLSVHGKEWVEYLEKKFRYHTLFSATSYSFETGLMKPDPKAYEIILRRLNAIPEESLFIDDSKKNIAAAEAIGMKTVLFESTDQLENALSELSIRAPINS